MATLFSKPSSSHRLVAQFVDAMIAVAPMTFFGALGYWAVEGEQVPSTWHLWVSIVAYSIGAFWPIFYRVSG